MTDLREMWHDNGSLKRIGRPPSWILNSKFLTASGLDRPVLMPNFVEIGHTIAEISRFFATVFKRVKFRFKIFRRRKKIPENLRG